MENSFQTSFIPKKPIIYAPSTSKTPRSITLFVSSVLMAIAIVVSGVLFLYKIYLIRQVNIASDSLSIIRDSFEKETIEELELFDKRTASANTILGKHEVFSPLFALLGDITIPSVQYTNFTEITDDKGHTIEMKGVALDYRSIALQAGMFSSIKGRSFSNVLFSDLNKDKNNNISFNLKFNVDPELLSYNKKVLLGEIKSDSAPADVSLPVTQDTTTLPTVLGGGAQ